MDSSNLTFRIRGPKGKVEIITISSASNFIDLFMKISEIFSIEYDSFEVLTGFPPEPCSTDPNMCLDGNVTSNSVLTVRIKEVNNTTASTNQLSNKKSVSSKASTKSTSTSVTNKSTSQIKISKSGEIIHQAVSSTSSSASYANKKIVTNKPSSSSSSGYHVINNTNTNTKKNEKSMKPIRISKSSSAGSENDIADHLISAVQGTSGKRSEMLRKVFRHAVQNQYKTSLSVSRASSGVTGAYDFENCGNAYVLGTDEILKIKVSFKSSPSCRTRDHTDEITLLSKELIRQVLVEGLMSTEGREILKPENLALSSPRIFWSIIYHYGNDFKHSYRHIFPETRDFEWLDNRKRELSEKALMNVEQQKEKARLAALKHQLKLNKKSNQEAEGEEVIDINTSSDHNTDGTDTNSNLQVNEKLVKKTKSNHITTGSTESIPISPSLATVMRSRPLHTIKDPLTNAMNTLLLDLSLINIDYLITSYPLFNRYLEPMYTYLSSHTNALSIPFSTSQQQQQLQQPSILHLAHIPTINEGSLTEVVTTILQFKKSMAISQEDTLSPNHTDNSKVHNKNIAKCHTDKYIKRSNQNNNNNNNNNNNKIIESMNTDSDHTNKMKIISGVPMMEDLDSSYVSMSNTSSSSSHHIHVGVTDIENSSATYLNEEYLKNIISQAQHDILNMIWIFLCGGSARLKRALFREHITCPYILSVWKIAPDTLFDNLLKHDNYLETVSVLDHFTNQNNHYRSHKSNKSEENENVQNIDETKNDKVMYTLFNREYLRCMCLLAYQLINHPATQWTSQYKVSILDTHEQELDIINQENRSIAENMYRKPSNIITSPSTSTSTSTTVNHISSNAQHDKRINNQKRNYEMFISPVNSDSNTSSSPSSLPPNNNRNNTRNFQSEITEDFVNRTGEVTRMIENESASSSSSSSSSSLIDIQENEWIYNETQHVYIGVRVRCYTNKHAAFHYYLINQDDKCISSSTNHLNESNLNDENNMKQNNINKSEINERINLIMNKYTWYEDGTVIGYFPPSENDPQGGLWKICLDCTHDNSLQVEVTELLLPHTVTLNHNIRHDSTNKIHSMSEEHGEINISENDTTVTVLRLKSDISTELKTRLTRRYFYEPMTARCQDIDEDELYDFSNVAQQAYQKFLIL